LEGIQLNTLNKVLKKHAEVYDPHRQLFDNLSYNKKLYFVLFLLISEMVVSTYFILNEKVIISLLIWVLFLGTSALSSYWHFNKLEKLYGIENLDIERLERFKELVNRIDIHLENEYENELIERLAKDRLEKISRSDQQKKNIQIAVSTTSLGIIAPFFVINLDNVTLITLLIMFVSSIIIFGSFKSIFKEYASMSRLEHLCEILIELRIHQEITNRIMNTSVVQYDSITN
jgi:hypothetical protein